MTNTDSKIYCVTGIDTDIGKTVVTGMLAKSFNNHGINTITQKFVQTGCEGSSEDIVIHRQIMGMEMLDIDYKGITCPYIFPVPCSPHLAAKLANKTIDCDRILQATQSLTALYDMVLLEGAGGLLVPITEEYTFLDYLERQRYPLILVTSPRLGSINHTLAAIELAYRRGLEVAGIVYNRHNETDPTIAEDSREIFKLYLEKYGFTPKIADIYQMESYGSNSSSPDLYTQLFA